MLSLQEDLTEYLEKFASGSKFEDRKFSFMYFSSCHSSVLTTKFFTIMGFYKLLLSLLLLACCPVPLIILDFSTFERFELSNREETSGISKGSLSFGGDLEIITLSISSLFMSS